MGKGKWVEDRFRSRLKDERGRKGWSQEELAAKLSARGLPMHWTTVAKIEKGTRSVRIDEAAGIADLLGVSIDAMLGRRVGLQDDLAYLLHTALETAGNFALQTATMAGVLQDKFRDLTTLKFEGYEAVYAEAERSWNALNEANDALWKLRMLEPPAGTAIGLRDAVVEQAAADELRRLIKEAGSGETQS